MVYTLPVVLDHVSVKFHSCSCCSLFMEAILLKYQTSHGTPTSHGLFALFLRTTSCRYFTWSCVNFLKIRFLTFLLITIFSFRCGKWQKTFTMMRSRKPQQMNWRQQHHEVVLNYYNLSLFMFLQACMLLLQFFPL